MRRPFYTARRMHADLYAPVPVSRARAWLSRAACLLAVLGGAWVAVSMANPATKIALPVRAMLLASCLSALLGAAGVALRRGPLPLLVLLLGFAAPMANTRLIGSQDTVAAAEIPFALMREGTLTLPGARQNWLVPLAGGRAASKYPVATALLALPFELPAALGRAPLTVELRNVAEKTAASALCASMLALLFLAQRRLAGERAAAIAAALTLLATPALPILGQALWQHTGAALALAGGLAALGLREGAGRAALVGFCAGLAVACRPPDLPLALALVALDRRRLFAAAAGAAVPVALTLVYQRAVFGGWLQSGYGAEASIGWRPPWPDGAEGLLGLWFSPGRGMVVVYPVLAFALLELLRRRELRVLGLGVLAHSLLMACWWAWEGGWCAGPRMLSDAVPFLGLGLAAALQRFPRWRPLRPVFVGAAALSLASAGAMTWIMPAPETKARLVELRDGRWNAGAWPLAAYLRGRRR